MFTLDGKYIRSVIAGTWAIACLNSVWDVSYAQSADALSDSSPSSTTAAAVDPDTLSKRIELITGAESLDDATKARLLEQLRLAEARTSLIRRLFFCHLSKTVWLSPDVV